jgi:UDP:flavonoid glycosyltransferase YjiC (YdhE family)
MARFLMWTGAVPGHVAPCIPIARMLIERGHEIVWITGRQYQRVVEATGASFYAFPKDLDPNGMEIYDFYPELKTSKGLAQIKHWVKHVFLDGCAPMQETFNSVLAEFRADVLLGDTVAFGLYFCSELRGLPFAQISLLPLSLASCDLAPWGLGLLPGHNVITKARNRLLSFIVFRILFRDITKYANETRRKLGLGPLSGPFFYTAYENIALAMQISTPAFEYPRSDQPETLHCIGPIIPLSEPGFEAPPWWSNLQDSKPLVLVNQGTVANDLGDLIVPTIVGLKDEEMQIVAVPVKEGQLNGLPAYVHAEPFVPFGHLFPHVDIMVTNGGYGATQWALAHGIPLVVAGGTEDKMEVAARVEWSGAGINLRKQRPTPGAVREAVKEVLAKPVYRENAQRIQADFAKHDAPTRAAELLEALASGSSLPQYMT